MKLLVNYHLLIFFVSVLPILSCSSQTKNSKLIETKITKEKLALFFEQNIDSYSINDIPLPITDLKSVYHDIIIKPFRNVSFNWVAEDSIIYSEKKFNNFKLSKSGKIVEHKKILINGSLSHRKFTYDENDKLIEVQFLDSELKVSGKTNYSYSDNYLKMYKIHSNYLTNTIDTSRYYEFDSFGRINKLVIILGDDTKKMSFSYNDQGLINNVNQTINFKNDPTNYELQYEFTYQYNDFGDWVGLIIYLDQNKQKGPFYKFVRELKE